MLQYAIFIKAKEKHFIIATMLQSSHTYCLRMREVKKATVKFASMQGCRNPSCGEFYRGGVENNFGRRNGSFGTGCLH